MATPQSIQERRAFTARRLTMLRATFEAHGVTDAALRRTCVYATGSVGRGEASEHSDLDIFMLDLGTDPKKAGARRNHRLGRIEQTLVKADIIRATRAAKFPEFSGDGAWLTVHSATEMLAKLGTPNDDSDNLFTARLLLLLEGAPLVNDSVYDDALAQIVATYWRDYDDHRDTFRPVMLANDLVRFWKTLTLNYEADRNNPPTKQRELDEWRSKRWLDVFKLGYSRLWICHSAIAYLVWLTAQGPVSPDDAIAMFRMSPSERFEQLGTHAKGAAPLVREILDGYAWFLDATDAPKDAMLAWISDGTARRGARDRNDAFGQAVYALIKRLNGPGGPLLRYVVV